MKTWNVKEVCKLGHVSARALHYYDKIGLLKPSARSANGYRVYSQHDLQKLQKIITLKFLGFMLNPIHSLVEIEDKNLLLNNLENHLRCLNYEIEHIARGQIMLLEKMLKELRDDTDISWKPLNDEIWVYLAAHNKKVSELRSQCQRNEFKNFMNRFPDKFMEFE